MRNIRNVKGFLIVIENTAGSIRKGVDDNNRPWSSEIRNPYGYFEGTVGSDGDEVDVFLGPATNSNFDVYVVNQNNEDGSFDEHKVMFGFEDLDSAREAYYNNYEDGWDRLGSITTHSLSGFRNWLINKDATIHPTNKASMGKEQTDGGKMKTIQLFGEVIEGETLEGLKKQAGAVDSFDTLIVEIASPGGSVSEGLEVMVWLDMLSQEGKHIITVVVANAYSIASLIMLSADMRFISKHGEVMVHNPMVPQLEYANANELQEYVTELRGLEGMMYDLYQVFTGLEKEQIKSLMDGETYLSPDDSVKHGFADTVIDIKKRSFEMTVNLKSEINMSKTFNILNKVIAMVNKSDFVNQLYYTQDGGQVEIFQADPATYKVGDKVEGADGETQLSDGAKLIVKDGAILEIDRSVEAAPVEEAVIEEPAGEPVVAPIVEDAAEEAAPLPEVIPEETQAAFNEGPAPIEPAKEPKAKDAMPAKVTEVTESVTTKETLAAATPEAEAPAPVEAVITPEVEATITPETEAKAEDEDKFKAFEDRIAKLEARAQEAEAKLENTKKFEDLATNAIDGIYKNTSSNFTPEAKATVELNTKAKGSIFSQAKMNAGLK